MKSTYFFKITFLICFPIFLGAQEHNEELKAMYKEDQSSRQSKNINWEIVGKKDKEHQARVIQMIKEGLIKTGKDYYHSAMIFQHESDTFCSSMAVKQMKKAIELDSTVNKWLLAAAIDRDLMRRNQPQIYGTQYRKMNNETKWHRYQIDSTKVTDEERKLFDVETLDQQREKERVMNLIPISNVYLKPYSLKEIMNFIKIEVKKGQSSIYAVDEYDINRFGYELMNENKLDEAIAIFKFNTELFPLGFNTYDSYAECLMKMGKKEESIEAYKKSLELNPQNESAKKILNELK